MMELERDEIHVPNKKKLAIYGPLRIVDHEEFMRDEASSFLATYSGPFPYQLKITNFLPLYKLGEGAFGLVILVKYKIFGSYYAMKVLSKKNLVRQKSVHKALNEKQMLQSLNFPFIIYLLYFSQDNSNIYFVLPFILGGELYKWLVQFVRFGENLAKFYAAQVVLGLEYLHRCGVIYRDVKPENILLDHFGYLKMTDFGLAKIVSKRTYTFCGTPDYIAPEIIKCLGYGPAVDWWSLGILVFEMASGRTPFYGHDQSGTFLNIIDGQYVVPQYFGDDLRHLVNGLLQVDVTKRLGNLQSGVEGVKCHAWFAGLNWLALLNRTVVPPFVPSEADLTDAYMKSLSDLGVGGGVAAEDDYDEYFLEF